MSTPTQREPSSMETAPPPRLFSIPELIQAVLLYLPLRDLLCAQRVCRLWKETTTHSLALQRKLFFHPTSPPHSAPPEFNPLLREVFSPLFRRYLHPWNTPFTSPDGICALVDWHKDESRRRKVLCPDASWRRMFPIQPPAKIEYLSEDGGCSCFPQGREGAIRDQFQYLQDAGATMGLLWDVAVHMLESHPEPSLFVHWHMFPLPDGDDEGRVEVLEKVGPVRNAVGVHVNWSRECYPGEGDSCGLSVGDFDPAVVKWDNEGKEEE